MPKKRTFNFKSLEGSSSGKQSSGRDAAEKNTTTVNERLGELRKLEGKDAAQKKRDLVEAVAVNQRSVHPSLRGVLGIQDTAPPKPKRGVRSRIAHRTPGPAPPESWLKGSMWTPTLTMRGRNLRRSGSTNMLRSRPSRLLKFALDTGYDMTDPEVKPPSLVHLALKTAAEQWALFDDGDLPALAELPLRLRLRFLAYLGCYGPAIDVAVLDAVTCGAEGVALLDLGGLIDGSSLTLQRIANFMKQKSSKEPTQSQNAVAESWDEEESFEAALVSQPAVSRFFQLTHLSLSQPPPSAASWRSLLAISKNVPNVTHLSLAYWPRPTFTPNLATTTVSSQHSPDINAGGSHYYSGLDKDLSEPATILRQLSSNLLRLQWLDLEGCAEWVPALAWGGPSNFGHTQLLLDGEDEDSWIKTPPVTSIFYHNWKNLQYLNVSQGWLPTEAGLQALPRQSFTMEQQMLVGSFLRKARADSVLLPQVDGEDMFGVERRKANIWLQIESEVVAAANTVKRVRRYHHCKPITISHGWRYGTA